MQVHWQGSRYRLLALVVWASAAAATPMRAQTSAVTLTPAEVVAGSPELIRVAMPAGATVDGEWLGQKLAFFRGREGRPGMRSPEWMWNGHRAFDLSISAPRAGSARRTNRPEPQH